MQSPAPEEQPQALGHAGAPSWAENELVDKLNLSQQSALAAKQAKSLPGCSEQGLGLDKQSPDLLPNLNYSVTL